MEQEAERGRKSSRESTMSDTHASSYRTAPDNNSSWSSQTTPVSASSAGTHGKIPWKRSFDDDNTTHENSILDHNRTHSPTTLCALQTALERAGSSSSTLWVSPTETLAAVASNSSTSKPQKVRRKSRRERREEEEAALRRRRKKMKPRSWSRMGQLVLAVFVFHVVLAVLVVVVVGFAGRGRRGRHGSEGHG